MGVGDFALSATGKFISVLWDSSSQGMGRKIVRGPQQVHQASEIIAHRFAPEVESYMKVNAPWTDRTGAARNGLAARAYSEAQEVGIVLYHQVSYGIWLEVRWSGKYAIINPTIDAMGPKVMAAHNDLLRRL